MSTIQENLQSIKSAVYGRDVRTAIHDAIYSCYMDGKAGSVDISARNDITEIKGSYATKVALASEKSEREASDNVLSQRVNNLITVAPIAGYLETVLYENATGAKGTGTEISLSGNISDYDYLDFYINSGSFWSGSGTLDDEISSVRAVTGKSYKLRTVNTHDLGQASAIYLGEMVITLSNTKVTITKHWYYQYRTAGQYGASSGNVSPSASPMDGREGKIVKIVGRKTVTAGELTDARVGTDGTVYESVGDAIRTQLLALDGSKIATDENNDGNIVVNM